MTKLSVNVNKIATLRNSRGGHEPCLENVVKDLISFGAKGITVHPRPDGRHILYSDVRCIKKIVNDAQSKAVEFNIEGRPSKTFLDLISEVQPHQCTLVPDPPSALTSDQGWSLPNHTLLLRETLQFLKKQGVRSSLFIDPLTFSDKNFKFLFDLSPDRVEIYTGKWVGSLSQKNLDLSHSILNTYYEVAQKINMMRIKINAGHDLNQQNLKILIQKIPFIQEVSIGHAFICEALYDGLELTLKKYLAILDSGES